MGRGEGQEGKLLGGHVVHEYQIGSRRREKC